MKQKDLLITAISILVILVFIGSQVSSFYYIVENIKEELFPLAINFIILIPALLGLWKIRHIDISQRVFIGFIIYGLITILGYINATFTTDPLSAGLSMIVIVLSFAVLFSIYLIIQINKES